MTTAVPVSSTQPITSAITASADSSSPLKGSSNKTTAGLNESWRVRARAVCWPRERSLGCRPSIFCRSSSLSTLTKDHHVPSLNPGFTRAVLSANASSSATEARTKRSLGRDGMRATLRGLSWGRTSWTYSPRTWILDDSARAIVSSNVVFPAPLSPTTATSSPRPTSRFTERRMT